MVKSIVDAAIKRRNSLHSLGDRDFVTDRDMGKSIPKIIHQTHYVGPDDPNCPKELKDNIAKLRELNPDWEYRFYDDAEIKRYIEQYFPDLLWLYLKIDDRYGAARADFFRYLLMYREGGVYLDIKSNVTKPLNELLHKDDRIVLCHWPRAWPDFIKGQSYGVSNPIGELQQWHIVTVPGHPFLKQVINNVCNNIVHYNPIFHDAGGWAVLNLTGPIAYTEAIFPILEEHPHRMEDDHLTVGLEYCAVGAEPSAKKRPNTQGHHKLYSRPRYSDLKVPIVKVPLHTRVLFWITRPGVEVLKMMHRVHRAKGRSS